MKIKINGLSFGIVLMMSFAGAKGQVYKYDFGGGKVAGGYVGVGSGDIYSAAKGFGFEPGAELSAVDRKGKNLLNADFITSKQPFFFSVALPEGNYNVIVTLGDEKGSSATTVRAECRRLMLENIRTSFGTVVTRDFTVHIRDSIIRDAGGVVQGKVKLKPRERGNFYWDNKLTIEFNDSLPKVCAVEIAKINTVTTVFLAGNSTVVDQDKEPWAAWGQMFPAFFQAGKVAIANYAESGETMKAFQGEKRLEKIWSMAKEGDYLFIEFTHNDQKPGGNHLDPYTTYTEMILNWVKAAEERGIISVLVTSMHRRNFDSTGHIVNTLLEYPDAMRKVAAGAGVTLIDLNAMSKQLYEKLGEKESLKAFVHFPANTFPNQPEPLKDNTHFSTYGAWELAKCVVRGLRLSGSPLAKLLKPGLTVYDPAKPGTFKDFYWPQSVVVAAAKPDGN